MGKEGAWVLRPALDSFEPGVVKSIQGSRPSRGTDGDVRFARVAADEGVNSTTEGGATGGARLRTVFALHQLHES